jgi:hypothetical protein
MWGRECGGDKREVPFRRQGKPGGVDDARQERATHKGALRSCISRRWAWTPERCERSGGVVIQHALQ